MFIKKDLRKVREILNDPEDKREECRLGRRAAEFAGTLKVLTSAPAVAKLGNLRVLSLYQNGIRDARGIGALSATPLEELNLGANELTVLPPELSSVKTLKRIWVEDNRLGEGGSLSYHPVTELEGLVELRLSNNGIKELHQDVGKLSSLEVLAIDGNAMETLDSTALRGLSKLRVFVANGNELRSLPEGFGSASMLGDTLENLSLSSNSLESLPQSFSGLQSLRSLRLNGNVLASIPVELLDLASLRLLNLANNEIRSVDDSSQAQWLMSADGAQDDKAVAESDGKVPEVTMAGNPLEEEEEQAQDEEEEQQGEGAQDVDLLEDDEEEEVEEEVSRENNGAKENGMVEDGVEGQGAAKRRRIES